VSVVVVGLEHRQTPLPLIERVAVGDAELSKVLGELKECANLQESVLLSTCLRTEVYAVVDRFHDAVAELEGLLARVAGSEVDELRPYLGVRFDDDVPEHLFAVASGLESAVVGESEVLGQVRRAWERSHEERASGPVLAGLFRHAVRTGRRVRHETAIGQGSTSFAHAAVEMVDHRLAGGLQGTRVVVVGAGHMGSGLLRALATRPAGRRPNEIVIANRTLERAVHAAAGAQDGVAVRTEELQALPQVLVTADVVITAVQSPAPVLSPAMLAARPAGVARLLIADLGVPHNVEPQVARLTGVDVLDMEDLRTEVDSAKRDRLTETGLARQIVIEEVERYRVANRARGASPVVSALRSRLEDVRVAELERRRASFGDISDADWSRIDAVTRSVLAKLVHEPTLLLKQSAGTPRGERLVEALRILFDL
jgi:glutamyl-tRNA reductase